VDTFAKFVADTSYILLWKLLTFVQMTLKVDENKWPRICSFSVGTALLSVTFGKLSVVLGHYIVSWRVVCQQAHV